MYLIDFFLEYTNGLSFSFRLIERYIFHGISGELILIWVTDRKWKELVMVS